MNKDMAAFFDALAPTWNYTPSEHETREKLVSMMGLPQNSVIADIGCGRGALFAHLLKTNPAKIIAVDASGEMIRLAAEQYNDPRLAYVHGDFLDVPLPMLDAAIFFNSYPHFLEKEALAEKLSRTIQKGGAMMITHSQGKMKINERHSGENVSKFSIPLESAEAEADKFQTFFSTDILIDSDEVYFIKMRRR